MFRVFFVSLPPKGKNMEKFFIQQSSADFDKIMAEIKKRGGRVCGNEKPIAVSTVNGIPCWGVNVFGAACFASMETFLKRGYHEIYIF